jgi:hypothetical protein
MAGPFKNGPSSGYALRPASRKPAVGETDEKQGSFAFAALTPLRRTNNLEQF